LSLPGKFENSLGGSLIAPVRADMIEVEHMIWYWL
jgi:hypothetical protein